MNIESSKTYQPSDVTEALRERYQEMSLTDDQARAILRNTTTHIILKPEPHEPAQVGVGN